jgi:tripartite-type tricarboxylate transporter receptor subunit TctC
MTRSKGGKHRRGMAMNFQRRGFLRLAAGAAALPAVPRVAWAEAYPARPVRLVVGFYASSGPDVLARIIAQWLSERFGQQFIVDNRPGAGGNIGTEEVVRAAPDGYTLLTVTPANTINVTLYEHLNFNFVRDIAPVAALVRVPLVMDVHPSLPATLPEFIAYAKANPGKINMASAGNGTIGHVAGELFNAMAGIDLVHVPYRDDPLPDLIEGRVQLMFRTVSGSVQYIRTGKLRALAVTTATRWQTLPEVPALSEFVPGYEATVWDGIGAPKDTPVEIVDALNKEINAGLADPKIMARLTEVGDNVFALSPADFRKFIATETEKWAKVIKFANIKAG